MYVCLALVTGCMYVTAEWLSVCLSLLSGYLSATTDVCLSPVSGHLSVTSEWLSVCPDQRLLFVCKVFKQHHSQCHLVCWFQAPPSKRRIGTSAQHATSANVRERHPLPSNESKPPSGKTVSWGQQKNPANGRFPMY